MREIKTYYYNEGSAVQGQQYYYSDYVYGNVVPAPAPTEVLPDRHTRRRELYEEEKRRKREKEKKNARALRASRANALAIILGVTLFGAFFIGYVNLQTSIRAHMTTISTLKNEISDMKAQNAAAQSRIATATDLNEIKRYALTNCGMVYANNGQIVYYDIADEDYMSQYEAIR